MSLQVWLPLNGDLHNQGLTNINIVNNGTIVNNNGKLGKCIEFGQNKYIKLNDYASQFLTYNTWSLSVWFKCTAQNPSHAGAALISGGNWNQPNNLLNLALSGFSSDHYSRLIISGSGTWDKGYAYNFYLNTWYHVVLTSGNGATRAYVNGQLIGDTYAAFKPATLEQTWIAIGNGTYTSIFHFYGVMNDIRIYDHCLSTKEVEEIAKGLVLHIKLDNDFLIDSSGYNHPLVISNVTNTTDTIRYGKSGAFSGTTSYVKINDNTWMAQHAQAMTINLWAKAASWNANTHFFSCTESGGFNTEKGNSGYLRFPIYVCTNVEQTSYAYKYDSKEIQISALPIDEWVMLTWIYDSTGTRTYINGQLHHTYTNTSYGIRFNMNARLFLGCEASTANPTTPYFNGQESDFRLYYTALTDTQILELYNTSATIDNTGKIYARELVEI